MRLFVVVVSCLAVLLSGKGLKAQEVSEEDWVEDTAAVAEELESIFGEEESDEEKPRIYLKGLVGVGPSGNVELLEPSVTNDCVCPKESECECCTTDEVNSKTITGCLGIKKAEDPETVNVLFHFNGLKVSDNVFSVNVNEENCRDILTVSEIMTLCINTDISEEGNMCMTTSFKTFDSTVELKYKCINTKNGLLSVQK